MAHFITPQAFPSKWALVDTSNSRFHVHNSLQDIVVAMSYKSELLYTFFQKY